MLRYVVRRLMEGLSTVVLVSIFVFALARVTGDPLLLMMPPESSKQEMQHMRELMGLDKPVYEQYVIWIGRVLRGDLGQSFRYGEPVMRLIMERLPNTLQLGLVALTFSILIGVTVGTISAIRPNGASDLLARFFAIAGQSMPSFWVGIMLVLILSVGFRLLPTSGVGTLQHLIMPAFSLAWLSTASIVRLTRSTMLDVLDSEYVKVHRIMGVPERVIIWSRAMKNAAIPLITIFAMQFVGLVSGSVIIETVFAWPGIGRLAVDAVFSRDFPMLQGLVLFTSVMVVLANLTADVLYAYVDPRIRLF